MSSQNNKEVEVLCLGGKFSQKYYNKHPELLVKGENNGGGRR